MSKQKENYTPKQRAQGVRGLLYEAREEIIGGIVAGLFVAIVVALVGSLVALVKRLGFGMIAIGLIAIIVLALLVLLYVYIRRMQLAMYWFLAAVITLLCYVVLIMAYQFLNDKYVLTPALWIVFGILLLVLISSVLVWVNRRR